MDIYSVIFLSGVLEGILSLTMRLVKKEAENRKSSLNNQGLSSKPVNGNGHYYYKSTTISGQQTDYSNSSTSSEESFRISQNRVIEGYNYEAQRIKERTSEKERELSMLKWSTTPDPYRINNLDYEINSMQRNIEALRQKANAVHNGFLPY